MDPALLKNIGNNGTINLSDYVLDKNSYNPIVYIHKRYLSKDRNDENNFEQRLKVSKTHNKGQQYDSNIVNDKAKTVNIKEQDLLLEKTIQFAKNIVPLTIPPSGHTFTNPVNYTIKASKKTKRKHDCEHKIKHSSDLKKEKIKHDTQIQHLEQNKKSKLTNSIEESVRLSQNDTIDDLCYSLSETSDQKQYKEKGQTTKIKENCKVIPSESFEALATQYTKSCGDSNIKIHLMNNQDKYSLCENISAPILKSIKDLFNKLHNQSEVSQDMAHVYKEIVTHSKKLDRIIERLTRIETKLEKFVEEPNTQTASKLYPPHHQKTSDLGEISKDIENIKENFSSEEELVNVDLINKKTKIASVTSILESYREIEATSDALAKGENVPECLKAISPVGIKPERANRIPARFCWTDSIKKN